MDSLCMLDFLVLDFSFMLSFHKESSSYLVRIQHADQSRSIMLTPTHFHELVLLSLYAEDLSSEFIVG